LLLNGIIWRSFRGGGEPMPALLRAGYVFEQPKDKDED
jgi:hypothetical protein